MKLKFSTLAEKREEQNYANFNSVAPSSDDLWERKEM